MVWTDGPHGREYTLYIHNNSRRSAMSPEMFDEYVKTIREMIPLSADKQPVWVYTARTLTMSIADQLSRGCGGHRLLEGDGGHKEPLTTERIFLRIPFRTAEIQIK